MSTSRAYQASAVLGGKWYVAGGVSGTSAELSQGLETFPTSIECYDGASGHWEVVGTLASGREFLAASADPASGKVLFVGGFLPSGPNSYSPMAESELGNASGWLTGSLLTARYSHAVALVMGRFLVSGGSGPTTQPEPFLSGAEVLDVESGHWSFAGTMPGGGRQSHSLTALADGKRALVVGGCNAAGSLSTAEMYDASTGSWKEVAALRDARCRATSILLNDGRVLTAGALNGAKVLASTEIYDPTSNSWQVAASMNVARYDFAAAALPDGRIIAVGGTNSATQGELGSLKSTEIYDPVSDSWTVGPEMHDARRWPSVAVLASVVFVTAGANAVGQPSSKDPHAMEVKSLQILATTERLVLSHAPIGGGDDAGTLDAEDDSSRDASAAATKGGCSCNVDPTDSVSAWLMSVALWIVAAHNWSRQRRKMRVGFPETIRYPTGVNGR